MLCCLRPPRNNSASSTNRGRRRRRINDALQRRRNFRRDSSSYTPSTNRRTSSSKTFSAQQTSSSVFENTFSFQERRCRNGVSRVVKRFSISNSTALPVRKRQRPLGQINISSVQVDAGLHEIKSELTQYSRTTRFAQQNEKRGKKVRSRRNFRRRRTNKNKPKIMAHVEAEVTDMPAPNRLGSSERSCILPQGPDNIVRKFRLAGHVTVLGNLSAQLPENYKLSRQSSGFLDSARQCTHKCQQKRTKPRPALSICTHSGLCLDCRMRRQLCQQLCSQSQQSDSFSVRFSPLLSRLRCFLTFCPCCATETILE
ncbi:hypothetical protein X801_03291 [Opisthorchis viverrini]|uniref:Uncharacterized protein n=2 Tax=Opisthorchis viverrini TaxID=6198 RepID=A0A1S8X293_OPIVI|nr:hypothetical protein T265_05968 [Opisthorchis viverrini]KER26832.1 hypothetical protein T265_05968 [Opisthorchis viverrini]OON20825.1 hypothetical protein X801_03291 [Opisthorchis viverrini]